MEYRKNHNDGDDLSILSFGFMRVGRDDGLNAKMVRAAVEKGVNLIDTAYIYPNNEATLGKILEREGLRGKVKIITKLPPYLVKKRDDAERLFNTSLARLRTDYVEYYLIHMLGSTAEWARLVESAGIIEWLKEKKDAGKIKNIGFSYHGNSDMFIELLDTYDWDTCMIQYNYLDEHTQAGRKGLLYAAEKNVSVIIMEPLRGGTLANRIPAEAAKIFSGYPVKRRPAEWALRWLWNQPQVTTVLSGMRNMDDLTANIAAAEGALPDMLTDEEVTVYGKVTQAVRSQSLVQCTYCGYCVPCPRGVDIPQCFDALNQRVRGLRGLQAWVFYIIRTVNNNAGRCNDCGKCEPLCPQKIEIRKELRLVRRRMEGPLYRIVRFGVVKFMKRRR